MVKESALIKQMAEAKRETAKADQEEQALDTQIETWEQQIQLYTSRIHLMNAQNDKLKAKYIKNEKQSSRLDKNIRKIQAEVMRIISQAESTNSRDSFKHSDDTKRDDEAYDYQRIKRKCRSYHGSPEKIDWQEENQQAVSKAKVGFELELAKLKQEHAKLSELEQFLKRKLGPDSRHGEREE